MICLGPGADDEGTTGGVLSASGDETGQDVNTVDTRTDAPGTFDGLTGD